MAGGQRTVDAAPRKELSKNLGQATNKTITTLWTYIALHEDTRSRLNPK